MKFKIDENLPQEILNSLLALNHDVHTVAHEHLNGQNDEMVFQAVMSESRVLITQDLDFSDTRRFKPGAHPGIVLIRMRHPSRRKLIERITYIFNTEDLNSWRQCFVVISDLKLRIKRP